MPRTESYLLRLTKSEKDELAQRAKLQGVSIAKLIRQRLDLDAPRSEIAVEVARAVDENNERMGDIAEALARPEKHTSATVGEIRAQMDSEDYEPPFSITHDLMFDRLVAKHKLRYPTATAERMARKELDSQ